MSISNFASMFSQRSGMGQSIAGSVIGSIMGYAMQNMMNRGIGSFLHSRGQNKDSMNTALNQIQTETANNPDHQLVQQIKSSTGIQDDNQARQYIQQAGIAAGIGIAVFFLVRWNGALERAVKKRTVDLQHANKDLEDANQKLKQQDQMQREFINIAAHELRTPIQPIIVTTELLGISPEVKEDEAEQVVEVTKGDLSIIARNAKRLERLSSDILDVIRIESSSFRLEKQEFDLGMLVKQAVEDSRRQATEGVEIRLANDQHISVFADKQRITQVLSNLLNNAIRFTKPQGTIYVAVQTIQGKDENNQVKVTVTDTGSGIDRAVLPRLFTKFSSTVKADSGTGLGLYICKSIIDAHGGLIWGENNPNNKGAAFGFIIPTKPIENQSHADVLARAVEKHESLQSDSVYSLARKAFGKAD